MKLALVLGLLCMAIGALGTPVPSSKLESNLVQSRQNPAQPVPAADDDDEDDDDDLELIPSEDDDDDEEEEDEEDEDDDYLERFFDDILGDDEDDDDEGTNQIEPQGQGGGAALPVASPSIPAGVQADLNEQSLENHAVGDSAEGEEDSSSYDEDVVPQGQAAVAIPEASVAGATVVLPQAPAPAASSDDDDDDDDEEDDDELGGDLDVLEEEDDDEDDADDGDDEDDEDDTLARRARESFSRKVKAKAKPKKHTNTRKHTSKLAETRN